MKRFKKTTVTRITAAFLSFGMLFGLTACGGGSAPAASGSKGTTAGSRMAESGTNKAGQASDLTLEDGEAKLIYREGFLAVAYHGPNKKVSVGFHKPNGEYFNGYPEYRRLSDGWMIVFNESFPDNYKDEVFLSISDHSDPHTPEKSYPLTETMTKDEAEAIGLKILEDHICYFTADTSPFLGGFEVSIYIRFLDEYHDQSLDKIEGLMDRFAFYAEDGTPLEQCFPDYTPKFEPGSSEINLRFMLPKDTQIIAKEEFQELRDKLEKELKPYAIYTAKDGSTQKLPFFKEEDSN